MDLAALVDALQKREQVLLAEIRRVGKVAQATHAELLALRRQLAQRAETTEGPEEAAEVCVSTAEMVQVLRKLADGLADLTVKQFVYRYEQHPDLDALCEWNGRHRTWPVAAVSRWFLRNQAPSRGRKTRP